MIAQYIWPALGVLLIGLAVAHQRKESHEGIAEYLFGPGRPAWIDELLFWGAYGAVGAYLVALGLLELGRPEWVIALQVSAGLYLGDGLVTHARRGVPAHSDFFILTCAGAALGFVSYAASGREAGDFAVKAGRTLVAAVAWDAHDAHFPWWIFAGLTLFFVLRIVASAYRRH